VKTLVPDALAGIDGLIRCEEYDRVALGAEITERTHAVYPHDQIYGQYCTVHSYVDCPPERVYAYMKDPYSLLEWTYSVRSLRPTEHAGLLVGVDAHDTPIYVRTVSNDDALTVDYHCAWDQGKELWMVYLNRVIPAKLVLDRPGSVVVWTNCHHPYYDRNPFPELSGDPEREWVGDWWPLFYAGHSIELENLKRIVEHRHQRGLPVGPLCREDP
jgi:hypothetical protein